MAKPKSRYTCQACGSVQHRWQGQCPDCAEWNTLVQESAEVSSIFAAKHNLQGGGRVIPLIGLETPAALPERLPSGLAEFDRAIGGGIVAGSAMLVGGDPGIGKSTLLLQVAARLASEGHKIVYVSGEESAEQVRLRAVRLGGTDEIGVFAMEGAGLTEVPNPSALFLTHRGEPVSGTSVFPAIEGSRPVLVEIQALTVRLASGATPRRAAVGWDSGRLAMILAVLEARCGMSFATAEVYLKVAGGYRLSDPGADLAVAAALVSAMSE